MKAKFVYEKFVQDSDPISDMGIGIKKKYENYLLIHYLNTMFKEDFEHLEKGFNLNPSTDLYFFGDTKETFFKFKLEEKIKKLISKKPIYYAKYEIDKDISPGEKYIILYVYETKIGKIGCFSYPRKTYEIKQYFGDLSAAVSLNIKKIFEER